MIKRQAKGLRIVPPEHRSLPFMALWKLGYDTTDISVSLDVTEARVYNILSKQREMQRLEKLGQSASSG